MKFSHQDNIIQVILHEPLSCCGLFPCKGCRFIVCSSTCIQFSSLISPPSNKMFTELFQTAALFTLQSDASYVPNLFQPKNGFIEHLWALLVSCSSPTMPNVVPQHCCPKQGESRYYHIEIKRLFLLFPVITKRNGYLFREYSLAATNN